MESPLYTRVHHRYRRQLPIYTTIKTTSVCDGDARSVAGRGGWLAGDTDGRLADWPVTVGVVS